MGKQPNQPGVGGSSRQRTRAGTTASTIHTTTSTMKNRIQNDDDPTSCLQPRRRKRRDPPDNSSNTKTSSHNNNNHPNAAMSSADFNYLSLPSLFGGRPVSSRFESSMNDCMLESGAYVSYLAEAMDPAPRLDPEGALGEPSSKPLPEEDGSIKPHK